LDFSTFRDLRSGEGVLELEEVIQIDVLVGVEIEAAAPIAAHGPPRSQ